MQTISDGDTNAWSASGPWGLAPHLRPGCLSARVPSGMRRANDLGPATGVGRVFWSSWGRVSCCELSDGKVRDVVRGLVDPIGLALDARNNRIFWSDAKAGKVQCANLDGSRVCDVATGLAEPWGIALGPTHIFWTERRRGAIMSCSLRTGQASQMPAGPRCPPPPCPATQKPNPNPGSHPHSQPESHPTPRLCEAERCPSLGRRSILGSPPSTPTPHPNPPKPRPHPRLHQVSEIISGLNSPEGIGVLNGPVDMPASDGIQIPTPRRAVMVPRRATATPAAAYPHQGVRAGPKPPPRGGTAVSAPVHSRPRAAAPSTQDIMRFSEDTLALMQEDAPPEFHDSLAVAHNASHF